MKFERKKHIALLSLAAVFFIGYVIWSQLYINHMSNILSSERVRVLNIARSLELWKNITINDSGYFYPDKLFKNEEIELKEINRSKSETGINKGEKMYILYYKKDIDETKFQRYFSDLVLDNYFYLITDADGKIKELFWDKP
ncbi:hypothetical protein [Vibrio quintilis]|uniref:Uncharacterized protein n=1 Tax=Vibrio quintilis TaxID=1117707 RepID=A0A1M7YSI2_9VIBR|nr:hypothetical protein [Vibrio quintilis]SHO55569.1 hypothetical protein VQ7734_01305 [Vibrio quintilis]